MIFMPPDNPYFITAACWSRDLYTPLGGIYILELAVRDHGELISEALELLNSIDTAFTTAQQTIDDADIVQCGREWALFAPGAHGHLEQLAKQSHRSWSLMAEVCLLLGFLTVRKTTFEANGVPVPRVKPLDARAYG